jgi:hypothetical protein
MRPNCRCTNTMRMDLKLIGLESVNWIRMVGPCEPGRKPSDAIAIPVTGRGGP